jgi:hypothetical protein
MTISTIQSIQNIIHVLVKEHKDEKMRRRGVEEE